MPGPASDHVFHMSGNVVLLVLEAMGIYFLVLGAHAIRRRFGLAHFYALIGGLTAIMSWVTDAGVKVEVLGMTFMVGSAVFYTALLLGVFVVYVFDGPDATRLAISTIVGVSIVVPLIAVVLHLQGHVAGPSPLRHVPLPSLRVNAASVVATLLDFIFLAISWEFFGKARLGLHVWVRGFITLLGVMWLDVVLFALGAFFPAPECWRIMEGSLLSRLVISVFACPFLMIYLQWQSVWKHLPIESRPVLAILHQVAHIQRELNIAHEELEARRKLQERNEALIGELHRALSEIKTLRGFLPICAHCKKIRNDGGYWQQIEHYVALHTEAQFSHGICPDCIGVHFPDFRHDREATAGGDHQI